MLDSALEAEGETKHFRNHDFRRTLRTLGSKLGIDGDTGEAMLAHQQPGIRGTYNRDDRLEQRRAAHILWGNFLLKCGNSSTNVVRLRKRK
jgi:integrase